MYDQETSAGIPENLDIPTEESRHGNVMILM